MVKKAIAFAMFGGEPKNPGKKKCPIRQVLVSIERRYLCLRIGSDFILSAVVVTRIRQ